MPSATGFLASSCACSVRLQLGQSRVLIRYLLVEPRDLILDLVEPEEEEQVHPDHED
jgi:hypothetical protein